MIRIVSPVLISPPLQNASKYKTEMCRSFLKNKSCEYGEKCLFAHGAQELRTEPRHPKYKTDLCRRYHSVGFCSYGPKCQFVHALNEVMNAPAQSPTEKKTPRTVKQTDAKSLPSSSLPRESFCNSPIESHNSDTDECDCDCDWGLYKQKVFKSEASLAL